MVWPAIVALVFVQTPQRDQKVDELLQRVQREQEEWDRQHMPPGFDRSVWAYMSREQKISVQVAVESRPHPVLKDTPEAAIEMVKAQLKDPDSAQFRGIRRRGPFDYCGWVNAKNSFGGYVGYTLFYATEKWTVILPEGVNEPRFCE